MIVKLVPHPDQIRWWVQSALYGFDTLDRETAVENAKADLTALLSYLDRTDDATRILGIAPVKSGIGDEGDLGKPHGPLFTPLEPLD
jgi:hypothetical protein